MPAFGNPSRNVLLLSLVSFITDTSSEVIIPILPMFIASIGGAGVAIGLIGGLGDSLSSIMNIFSGYLSDRFAKRKPFVYLGYGLSALMKLFYPSPGSGPSSSSSASLREQARVSGQRPGTR